MTSFFEAIPYSILHIFSTCTLPIKQVLSFWKEKWPRFTQDCPSVLISSRELEIRRKPKTIWECSGEKWKCSLCLLTLKAAGYSAIITQICHLLVTEYFLQNAFRRSSFLFLTRIISLRKNNYYTMLVHMYINFKVVRVWKSIS